MTGLPRMIYTSNRSADLQITPHNSIPSLSFNANTDVWFYLPRPLHVFTPMRMEFCPLHKNSTFFFFFQILTHLGEGLKDVSQHLQRRLPAGVMLVQQLRHHKVEVVLQLPAQRVVQQVLQVDLPQHVSSGVSSGRAFRRTIQPWFEV